MFEPIRQIFRSQTFQKSRQILVFFNQNSTLYNSSSSCCLIIFTVISQSELYFIFCSAFTATTAAPSLPHAPTAFPWSFLVIDLFLQSSSALMSCFPSASHFILLYFFPTLNLLASLAHHSSAGRFGPSGLCTRCPRTELGLTWLKYRLSLGT